MSEPKSPLVGIPVSRTSSTGSIKDTLSRNSSFINKLGQNTAKRSFVDVESGSYSLNFEDYEIKSPIGFGSSAVVYHAIYKPTNKKVAIKMIDLDLFERNQIDELRRETQVMALCKHCNLLSVHGAFVHDSKLYLVTPYLSGEGFDEISIATILKQALQGLEYLHKNGHIHRDIKSGNLLMDEDGSVMLADFGVSSSLMESGERRGKRKTFVGTPCWLAPEVIEQSGGYDYKADIWSFGITAIELATGHAPFSKYPPLKVLMMTISNDPPTLDRETTKHKYSKTFKDMIDTCLQKDPQKRPAAEKLLLHPFFKQAKKRDFLVKSLLSNLPPLEHRQHKKVQHKRHVYQKGVSWDFDGATSEGLGPSLSTEDESNADNMKIEVKKPVENVPPSAIIKDDQKSAFPEQQSKHIAFVPGDVVAVNKSPVVSPGEWSKNEVGSEFLADGTGIGAGAQEQKFKPGVKDKDEGFNQVHEGEIPPRKAREIRLKQPLPYPLSIPKHFSPAPIHSAPSHGSTFSSPPLSAQPLSRESSTSRDEGCRCGRFTIERPEYVECMGIGRRGRFEVSTEDTKRGGMGHSTGGGSESSERDSVNGSPSLSPYSSISRGQQSHASKLDPAAIGPRLEFLVRQNELQKQMLTELIAGISSGGKSLGNMEDESLERLTHIGGQPYSESSAHSSMLYRQLRSLIGENEKLRQENARLHSEVDRLTRNINGNDEATKPLGTENERDK
ncbi:uncharacterized protein VTP21DRAFT_3141 [Calcarisporiella thermophila]|uniref:uncharacterized protein n=1 Tax=Calcarisporiella thermophila TaxID=911321 RepID=UPI0037428C7F